MSDGTTCQKIPVVESHSNQITSLHVDENFITFQIKVEDDENHWKQ